MTEEEKILRKKQKKEKRKKTKGEFKKFIFRGNIIDLAVAVAVGSAFTAIVNSFVKDIIGGLMGWLMGDVNLDELKIYLGKGENAPTINYGSFIQSIIYFLIIATVMFCVIKLLAKLNSALEKLDKKFKREEEKAEEPEVVNVEKVKEETKVVEKSNDEEIALLKEIRDLLKENKKA